MQPDIGQTLASPGTGTLIGQLVIVVLSIISTAAMLWKTSNDQKHQMDMFKLQHDIDAQDRKDKAEIERQDRATLALNVKTEAEQVRQRLEIQAHQVQQTLNTNAYNIESRVAHDAKLNRDTMVIAADVAKEALDSQTTTLTGAIGEATGKADAAYHEANTVNVKLEKLHQAHALQSEVLQQLLEKINSSDVLKKALVEATAVEKKVSYETKSPNEPR